MNFVHWIGCHKMYLVCTVESSVLVDKTPKFEVVADFFRLQLKVPHFYYHLVKSKAMHLYQERLFFIMICIPFVFTLQYTFLHNVKMLSINFVDSMGHSA